MAIVDTAIVTEANSSDLRKPVSVEAVEAVEAVEVGVIVSWLRRLYDGPVWSRCPTR